MKNIRNLFAYEYCESQQAEHFESLGDYLDDSLSKMVNGEKQEWILVGVFETDEERAEYASKVYPMILDHIDDEDRLLITTLTL